MLPDRILKLAETVLAEARAKKLMIVTAESCTGGLVAGALTEIPGSSDVVERGFVTYSNAAKHQNIFVPDETLDRHGAVSAETARAMAEGALKASKANLSVAITGVAGPGGGSPEKPVGLVHFAASNGKETIHEERRFGALTRGEIRLRSVEVALELLRRVMR